MSVKILLYTLLKQIGIFLVVSFLVFRGTFVESDSLGLNLSTGVSLLLSVILWGIINLHTYWLIPGYLFQRRYKKYIIYLSCLVGFMLTAMVGAICFLGQYYVIPEQMQRLNSDLPFFLLINALALILYFLAFSFTIFLNNSIFLSKTHFEKIARSTPKIDTIIKALFPNKSNIFNFLFFN